MLSIRSPLAALGAVMVLLEGIAAGALVPLSTQPQLQALLVYLIVGTVLLLVLTVIGLIIYITKTNIGLLFNPQDIDPSVHRMLYIQPDRLAYTVEQQKE